MPEVLIVDVDPSVRELLTMYFEKEQFVVRTAADGVVALNEIARKAPDIVILDIMMPQKDGYAVCRELRARGNIPIIFLTARDEEIEPIIGLEMGADDYVTKPFNAREVVARARAVLRRTESRPASVEKAEPLSFPQFTIDPQTREARVNAELVPLTPREFDIVYLLCTQPRRVFSRAEIMSAVWGYGPEYTDFRTVDTHLKRARQKLQNAGLTACRIEAVWGIGYRFVPPEE